LSVWAEEDGHSQRALAVDNDPADDGCSDVRLHAFVILHRDDFVKPWFAEPDRIQSLLTPAK
jgi:hypothetical protein